MIEGSRYYIEADAEANRREWHRYYGPKRAGQQHMQLELIGRTEARRVLEIGPYLGYVTALLGNAGYAVTTLDLGPRQFTDPPGPHVEMDLLAIDPARLAGHDAILCCETLEHLPFARVPDVLKGFAATGARTLIVSVPYSGAQGFLQLYANGVSGWRQSHFRLWSGFRRFRPDPDPLGHKWECGYRDTPLRRWEGAIGASGWRIVERVFTAPTRSVFHRCENATLAPTTRP
ncbi:MAG: hypothetical protein IT557_06875 [Alphaproteobacteria bacterium]|nr:hypothetical protein [Alphaproteobacteria bacterium]